MKNYDNLFKSPWCPLFGHLPELYDKPENSPERRCVEIIYEARELWGINPYFHTCSTSWPEKEDLPPEKPSEIWPIADLKEAQDVSKIGKYPLWKVEAARCIMRASEVTLQKIIYFSLPNGINNSASLDIEWEKAVYFIRKGNFSRPRLDERITDTEILSILAINEAWHALGSALYWGDCREDVLRQLLISSALLMKCKEVHTKTIINSQLARLEDQERIQEPEKYYNVYDENGRRKGYIKQQGENYILYNEKWQREGYIKSE